MCLFLYNSRHVRSFDCDMYLIGVSLEGSRGVSALPTSSKAGREWPTGTRSPLGPKGPIAPPNWGGSRGQMSPAGAFILRFFGRGISPPRIRPNLLVRTLAREKGNPQKGYGVIPHNVHSERGCGPAPTVPLHQVPLGAPLCQVWSTRQSRRRAKVAPKRERAARCSDVGYNRRPRWPSPAPYLHLSISPLLRTFATIVSCKKHPP